MAPDIPKYALLEIERKMRVDAACLPPLDVLPSSLIVDRYLDGGRLRLRKIVTDGGETQYKMCKKYGEIAAFSEPITNLYLTHAEYHTLAVLPGRELVKRRWRYPWGAHIFSIDEFTGPLAGLYQCEIEAASVAELDQIVFPPFCVEDVTGDPAYSGASLARQ